MKKVFYISCLILIASIAAAGSWVTTTSNIDTKPSNNVSFYYGVANDVNYVLGSHHLQGNRVFATTNQTTKIYYKQDDTYKGNSQPSVTFPSEGATTISGWSEL